MNRRTVLFPCLLLLLGVSGCFPHLLPTGVVVQDPDGYLGPSAPSGMGYEGLTRKAELPVPPFQLWGLDFEEEVLFEFADHPTWGMMEITPVKVRGGETVWFVLASERSGVQHVIVNGPEMVRLAQVFPAPTVDGGLEVVRLEVADQVIYDARFKLPTGEDVHTRITAKARGKASSKRNGNGMNHSQDRVLAIIDLEESNWATAWVQLDGTTVPVRRLAGLVPFAWRLEQAVGGVASGELVLSWGEAGASARVGGAQDPLEVETWSSPGQTVLVVRDPILDYTYRYRQVEQGLELDSVEVRHGEVSVFSAEFNPALPDLRYPVDKAYRSKMVAGVNGQRGYMAGEVVVQPREGGAQVEVLPSAPFWACERPVRVDLDFGEGEVRLDSEIAPELAADGAGRAACFARR